MKMSDRIIFSIVAFLLFFALFAYLFNSYLIALLLSFGLCLVCFFIMSHIKRKDVISTDAFAKRLLLLGKEESDKLIEKLHPTAVKTDYGYLLDDTIVINKIKYSSLSEEDIASSYRLAVKENIDKVKIYCLKVDKRGILLINELLIKVETVNIKKMYNELKRGSLLPEKPPKLKKKGIKGLFVGLIFIPTKGFLFASVSLAILSLLSPIKLYYLVFAFTNALIGLIVEIIKNRRQAN